MSLIYTESFMAYGLQGGDDAFNAANTTIRKAVAAALQRGGYKVYIQDQTAHQTSTGFMVRADPVYPDRAALIYSSGTTGFTGAAYAKAANIAKVIPDTGDPIICGFSLFVPAEYVPSPYNTGVQIPFSVLVSDQADPTPGTLATTTAFTIGSDLCVRAFSGAPQSTKALIPGRLAYIEFRISESDVKVWIDDVLVLQNPVSLVPEAIGFQFTQNSPTAPNSFMMGAASRWAISNIYMLTEDAYPPNVRLGPTTRVIGARPNVDVSTNFVRPTGPVSNAAVAGQDLVDSPPASLQSTTVGDKDVYATTADTATASGKLIYAVATKVLASNLESNPHTMRALVISAGGTEREDPRPRVQVPFATSFTTKALYASEVRPSDGAIFVGGMGPALFKSGPNANPSNASFTSLYDESGATVFFMVLIFRPDGTGILTRSDGKYHVIAPGTDVPGPALAMTVASTRLSCGVVTNDGSIVIGGVSGANYRLPPGANPSVPANWIRNVLPASNTSELAAMVYLPAINRIVAQIGGTTNVATSDDLGATWTIRAVGLTNSFGASPTLQLVTDDTNLVAVIQNTTTAYMRRSADGGVSWATINYAASAKTGGQAVIGFAFGMAGTMMLNASNVNLMSRDGGNNWRRLTSMPGGMLHTACTNANGDWFMFGDAGMAFAYIQQPIDAPLVPLAGYQATFNAATINPDTGAAWTPAEAAATRFGMRITS